VKHEPVGATQLSDVLLAWNVAGGAMLAANIEGVGWEFIATLEGVNAIALQQMPLQQMIDSEQILAASVAGFGNGAPDVLA
jgi:hypothetical protein